MIWSDAGNMWPKSYGWKKLWSWMLWKTECKVLVWHLVRHKILVKRLLFCLCKIWVCKFGELINRFGLEGGTCFKFFAYLNLAFVGSSMRFVWSNIGQKSPFLFQDLMPKLLVSCKYFIVLCYVYFSRKWNLMTCLQCSLSQLELSSPFAGKEWDFMGITYQGWEEKRVWVMFSWKIVKKWNS